MTVSRALLDRVMPNKWSWILSNDEPMAEIYTTIQARVWGSSTEGYPLDFFACDPAWSDCFRFFMARDIWS